MKAILAALMVSALLAGCVASSGSDSRPPNYVLSQAAQGPGIRNDSYGGAAMPMRGMPR